MKKLLLMLLLTAPLVSIGQTKFGIKAGVNLANVNIQSSGTSNSPGGRTGFHATGFADFMISNCFSLQPGVSYQEKGFNLDSEEAGIQFDMNLSYVEIPVNGVLHLPAGPGRVFLGAGPFAAFGVFGEVNAMTPIGGSERNAEFGGEVEDDASPLDFGLNFMAGYQLYNGLLLNAGYGLGLTNTIPKDRRIDGQRTHNKVLSVSVGFAF